MFQKLTLLSLFFQIVLITWLGSGTSPQFLLPIFCCAAFAFISALLHLLEKPDSRYDFTIRPAFWIVAAFFLVEVVQCFNFSKKIVGEECFFTIENLEYIKWLPHSIDSSFANGNAMFSLMSLSAGFMSACALYTIDGKYLKRFLWWIVANISLLGVVSIIIKSNSAHIMFGYIFTTVDAYGSFILTSGASAFQGIGLSCSLALLLWKGNKSCLEVSAIGYEVLCLILAILCGISAVYSGSNAYLLTVFANVFVFISIIIAKCYKKNRVIILLSVFSLIPVFLYFGFVNSDRVKVIFDENVASLQSRMNIYSESLNLVEFDNLIFGAGGESFKYAIAPSIVRKSVENKDVPVFVFNAHCDVLEFLFEYGIFGLFTIAALLFLWGRAIIIHVKKLSPYNMMLIGTILVNFIHSSFDLILRCPSIIVALSFIIILSLPRIRPFNLQ